MADNYLENKMEELRSGRLERAITRHAANPKKGCLQVPFPPKRVLVTGGVNGIGLAIAKAFLKADCKVAVFDKDKTGGETLAHDLGIRFHHVDISDEEALTRNFDNLLASWRDVDIIVSNAGISKFKPLEESSIIEFDNILATNLRPLYILGMMWGRHRRKYPIPSEYGGRLIAISSTRHIQSETGTEAYSASKGGIASLTHALMMSLSEYGITVNCISPGWIHTGDPANLTDEDHMQHPSRRVGIPDDIARLCMFLSLPGNNFINGADIPVDGGMTRKMIYQ